MQEHVQVRDVILAMTASFVQTPSSTIFREMTYAPCADWGLLSAAFAAAKETRATVHVGGIYSSDTFYSERNDLTAELMRHGVLGVEMEAAELYTVAARHDARALAVLTVSDHILTGESLPAEDRERSFSDMVEIALRAAFA
jgi:purine-nucleoside phosphorylase